jgi:hypothetical protein
LLADGFGVPGSKARPRPLLPTVSRLKPLEKGAASGGHLHIEILEWELGLFKDESRIEPVCVGSHLVAGALTFEDSTILGCGVVQPDVGCVSRATRLGTWGLETVIPA